MPTAPDPEPDPHPDDRPAPLRRRTVPAGVWWALALAVLVATIAGWRALSVDPAPAAAPGDVVHLGGSTIPPSLASLGLTPSVDPVGAPASGATWTTADGRDTSFAAYRGTPVVVNFWASWCTACIDEMPGFQSLHGQLGDRVAFVGLDVTDDPDAASALAQRTGVTYDLGRDPTGAILQSFGGVVMPTTALIDRDGTVVWTHAGALKADELEREIRDRLQP